MNPSQPKTASSEQEIQRTLMQLEAERRRFEALSKQGQLVESALIEVNATIQALNSMAEVKEGTEILVSLGANTFVKATLKDKENVMVGVGAGVSIEKKRAEAVSSLEARREELSKTMGSIQKMSAEAAARVEALNDAAEGMINAPKQQ